MKMNICDLSHHPENQEIYSLSDIEDLMDSIQDVGLLQPLVINQHNQVISGNRRFLAITKLDWKEVEVEQVVIPDDEVGKYLVHYNKFRKKSYREILNEYSVLTEHFKSDIGRPKKDVPQNIVSGSSRDMISNELNISSSQIGKLLVIQKEDNNLIDLIDSGILTVSQAYIQVSRLNKERESRLIEEQESSISPNDSFMFHQSCSSKMIELDDSEVQLCFTSPPYWNKRKYSEEEGWIGNEKSSDQYVQNLINHFQDTYRVLNDRGSFFLNIGDTFDDGNLQNIPHRVVIGLQEKGWFLRNTIIWNKTNPKPSSSKTNLTPSYEFIFHLVKSKDYFYRQVLTEMKDKSKSSLPPRHRNMSQNSVSKIFPYIPRNGKNIGDYWDEGIVQTAVANQFKSTTKTEHPAPFPEQIVILPLLQTTNPNDLVLDTFHGSGTTGKVSTQYGRRYVGYDLKTY